MCPCVCNIPQDMKTETVNSIIGGGGGTGGKQVQYYYCRLEFWPLFHEKLVLVIELQFGNFSWWLLHCTSHQEPQWWCALQITPVILLCQCTLNGHYHVVLRLLTIDGWTGASPCALRGTKSYFSAQLNHGHCLCAQKIINLMYLIFFDVFHVQIRFTVHRKVYLDILRHHKMYWDILS